MSTPTLPKVASTPKTSDLASASLIRRVTLRTRNAKTLGAFYAHLLSLVPESRPGESGVIHLVRPSSKATLITLLEDPQAPSPTRGAPGLFHIAFLFPDLIEWKITLRRMLAMPGLDFHGAADHAVSWAVYLADPDGNGIELAWDKPENEWPWKGDRIQMVSLSLPLRTILAQQDAAKDAPTAPMHIGHLHLQTAQITNAQAYLDHLKLRVTQDNYSGAVFMARGRYHHHLAVNTWNTRPGISNAPNAIGLVDWDMVVPGDNANQSWTDPAGAEVRFVLD
jgi:catechol 2,3-dioxygenase